MDFDHFFEQAHSNTRATRQCGRRRCVFLEYGMALGQDRFCVYPGLDHHRCDRLADLPRPWSHWTDAA
jgi:hypothetical protein